MERRALLAAVLSFVVIVVWNYLFPPPQVPEPTPTTVVTASPTPNKEISPSPVVTPPSASVDPLSSPAQRYPIQQKVIESKFLKVAFTSEGGSISSALLKDYTEFRPGEGPVDKLWSLFSSAAPKSPPGPMELFPLGKDPGIVLVLPGLLSETDRFLYRESESRESVWEREQSGLRVTKSYRLSEDSFLLSLKVKLENLGVAPLTTAPMLAVAGKALDPEKEGSSSYAPHPNGVYLVGDTFEIEPSTKLVDEPIKAAGTVSWVGVDDRYFLRAILPEPVVAGAVALRGMGNRSFRAELEPGPMTLQPGQVRELTYSIFLGPKRSEVLSSPGRSLEKSLDFGMLSLFAEPLLWLLKKFHSIAGSWGLAIMLLTFMVKMALYPLFVKQMESAQRMKEFQPHMKALQDRYKDDKNKLNQEMMKFMQENRVNPLGGCLPLLLQMPIWFALYHVLQNAVELYHVSFLYLPDLAAQDPYGISPLILGVLMYIQQKMTPMAPGMDPVQAKMLQYMPVIFAAMMFTLPSGLVVYILVNTLLGILQQLFVTKRLEQKAALATQKRR